MRMEGRRGEGRGINMRMEGRRGGRGGRKGGALI